MKPFIYSFANNKGGTGKTTTTANFAYLLSLQKKVLLIDLDQQRGISDFWGADTENTIFNITKGKQPERLQIRENLFLICGDSRISDDLFKENLLLQIDFTNIDVVIFDCPPESIKINYFALSISNFIFCVTEIAPLAIRGVERLQKIATLAKKEKQFYLIVNKYKSNRAVTKLLLPQLQSKYKLLNCFVPDSTLLINSVNFNKSVCEAYPKAKVTAIYINLFNEILTLK